MGKRKAFVASIGANVGREGEHSRDDQPELRLRLRWRAWRRAVSVNVLAASMRPAACSRMAVCATSACRNGWFRGARSRAR